jgi:hypothetical protein
MFEDIIMQHFRARREMAPYRTSYRFLLLIRIEKARLRIGSSDITFVPGFVKIDQFIQMLRNRMVIS